MSRPRRLGFKPHIAVATRTNRAAVRALIHDPAKLAQFDKDFPVDNLPPMPKPRAAPGADGRPLEADVLSAVGDLLHQHPRVSYALRINSGQASYEAKSGKYAPVAFHIWVRSPVKCRMPDFFGALVDGRTLALECKRPGWKQPADKREYEQAAFLMLIRNLGGIGEFVTDVEQVAKLLEGE
jgi:hypothetical protein